MCGTRSLVKKKEVWRGSNLSINLLAKYEKVASKNKGKWFALKTDGELLVVAKDDRSLWKKIRKKLAQKVIKEIDLIIGYSPTRKEKETMCLLPLVLTKDA